MSQNLYLSTRLWAGKTTSESEKLGECPQDPRHQDDSVATLSSIMIAARVGGTGVLECGVSECPQVNLQMAESLSQVSGGLKDLGTTALKRASSGLTLTDSAILWWCPLPSGQASLPETLMGRRIRTYCKTTNP